MGSTKIDKKKFEALVKSNAALKKELEKMGIKLSNLQDFYELSDEAQAAIVRANYDKMTEGGIIILPVECGAGQHWDEAAGKCVPNTIPIPEPHPEASKDVNGITKIYKDAPSGLFVNSSQFTEEEFTRNYASGKPSENSYENEYKAKDSPDNIEVTAYVKINGFKKEPDTISIKTKGPDHQDGAGKAWYINQVMTDGSDKMTFQIESPHPENHDNHVKPFFGIDQSLVGKWIGIKAISYTIDNNTDASIETWIDFPVEDINNPPNKWRKYIDIPSAKALDHGFVNATGGNVLIRIDGTKKGDMPNVKYQSLREILPEGNVPTEPPTVPIPPEPPVPGIPPQPPGQAQVYDSNTDGGWNNGTARLVTDKDGNIAPNGKGLEMHASGNPQLRIDGKGTAILECEPGHGRAYIFCKNYNGILEEEVMFDANVENHTIQTRSRHQEGGDGPNRFGGLSAKVSPVDVGLKIERFHNEHLADTEKKLSTPLELGKWHKVRYTFSDVGAGIYQSLEVNGQKVIEQTTTSGIEPYFQDKAKFNENSYFWLRMNNTKAAKLGIRNVKLMTTL